jgi:uncharacterized phage protein (TIGR02216 family)
MAAGFGILRLDPRAFWAMTVPEMRAALGAVLGQRGAAEPPGRADLDTLMQAFPDQGPPAW